MIAAIDPGLAGAVALVDATGRLLVVDDLPVAGTGAQRRIDAAGLAELLRHHAPSLVMVESVAAMPGQGVSSTFRFGQAVGAVAGVTGALGLPLHWVAPGVWKRSLRLSADKEQSRQRALELWPGFASRFARKADHNRAEAALIGLYACGLAGHG